MKKILIFKQKLRLSETSLKMVRHWAVKDCGNGGYALERWKKPPSLLNTFEEPFR